MIGGHRRRTRRPGPCWDSTNAGSSISKRRRQIGRGSQLSLPSACWLRTAQIESAMVAFVAFAAWAVYGPEPRLAFGLVAAAAFSLSPIRARSAWRRQCRSW